MIFTSGKLLAALNLASIAVTAGTFNTAIEQRVQRTTISNQWRNDVEISSPLYPANYLLVPIDHFHNDSLYEPHTEESFNLRYWFDATYYKPGGPVIVLQAGETDGSGRLPYLKKGILHQLIVATNGIGVVLEHRYYGTSMPMPDFSTENLRFLTTDQAVADQVFFARNVKFPGLEHLDLTAPNVAYIGYGGSYAGGFVAILRKLYPDVFWGCISSSGVIEAVHDYWAYFEPIRVYADQKCVSNTQKLINVIDNIILGQNDQTLTIRLKNVFGLPNVTHDDDFASIISKGIYSWQNRNWDPELNDLTFEDYCNNITSSETIYPETSDLTDTVKELLKIGGYESEVENLATPWLNWVGWLNQQLVSTCIGPQDYCFGTYNTTFYEQDDISQDWRAWPYQYCTQWGYLQTGSGVPNNQLPLLSRTITLERESLICKLAFNITSPPNVAAINKYGGFALSYSRLAMIDGEQDPWRPVTAHANPFNSSAINRTSTISEPFILISGGVHHWDENGRLANETIDTAPDLLPPAPVRQAQAQEVTFVTSWMEEWQKKQPMEL
ncbi:unnamed protein product [Blumeria hordei]|uniref:Uncharacterized protein n=2 Tax=Blumeria hordei TaxID=2867405 RepID=A0A383V0I0_BLUHO|nr:hypothetical protein BGHDH14_bgh01769 [Blumeria hordei DH14]SZF06091.1 unnamed protein product [Blumeria hordei]